MRFLALETDSKKIIRRYCSPEEIVLHVTHFHGMLFTIKTLKNLFITLPVIAIIAAALYFGSPVGITLAVGAVALLFSTFPILKAWIDWQYDYIIITSDKIVLVDQSSIVRQHIKPINYENIGSVSLETQWFNMFNFGIIHLDLKEGEGGGTITKDFVPYPQKIGEVLSAAVTNFQRGRIINVEETTARFSADDQVEERLEKIKHTFENVTKPEYEEKKRAEYN